MRRIYLLFFLFAAVLVLLVTTTVHNWLIKRDLGFICSVFKEEGAMNVEGSATPSKSIEEIDGLVKETIFTSAAKELWHNSFMFEPKDRYSGFKGSVDKLLEEPWNCKPMESYFAAFRTSDKEFGCPKLNQIGCMPVVPKEMEKYCSGPYYEWIVKNCQVEFTW
jgi:hypothetical protein